MKTVIALLIAVPWGVLLALVLRLPTGWTFVEGALLTFLAKTFIDAVWPNT